MKIKPMIIYIETFILIILILILSINLYRYKNLKYENNNYKSAIKELTTENRKIAKDNVILGNDLNVLKERNQLEVEEYLKWEVWNQEILNHIK